MSELNRDYIVDFEILDETILDYSRMYISIEDSINKIETAINKLYEYGWSGEAKEAFQARFDIWLKDIKDFNENLLKTENTLKVMNTQTVDLDNEGGKLLNYL